MFLCATVTLLFAEEGTSRGLGNGTGKPQPLLRCVLQSFPSPAEIENASPSEWYTLVSGRTINVDELVFFCVKNRKRDSNAGWYFDAEGKIRGEILCALVCSGLEQTEMLSLDEIRSLAKEITQFVAESLSLYVGGSELRKLGEERKLAVKEYVACRDDAQRAELFPGYIRAQIRFSGQKSLSANFVDRGEVFARFVDLLLLAYPDDIGEAVALYEKSLIPQKTTWGNMSDSYLRPRSRKGVASEKTLRVYKQIRTEEVLREQESPCRLSVEDFPEIYNQSITLRRAVKELWAARGSRSREELCAEANALKNKIRDALTGYLGIRGEIRSSGNVILRANEHFSLYQMDGGESTAAKDRLDAALRESRRQKLYGRLVADQLCTFARFVDLLLLVYPDDISEAVALYEESLIPEKTIWGKMSDVYRAVRGKELSETEEQVYTGILEAERRRERQKDSAGENLPRPKTR